MQTRNADLQSKLDHLNALARQGNREAFVRAFVPLDLTEEDLQGFLEDLQTEPEQWTNLKAEIDAIASGTNVTKIQGDQVKKATYFFRHPLIELCDREVCAKREARPSAVLSRGPDATPPRPFRARRWSSFASTASGGRRADDTCGSGGVCESASEPRQLRVCSLPAAALKTLHLLRLIAALLLNERPTQAFSSSFSRPVTKIYNIAALLYTVTHSRDARERERECVVCLVWGPRFSRFCAASFTF